MPNVLGISLVPFDRALAVMLSWQLGGILASEPGAQSAAAGMSPKAPAMTINANHLFYLLTGLLTLLATIPDDVLVLVPAKYKPYVVAAGVIAMWLKSHLNLIATPPGPPQEPPAK